MKNNFLLLTFLFIGFTSVPAYAQSVDFDIHIGPRPVPAPPPPLVVGPPPVIFEAPPRMVYVDPLRAYVAVGTPYDLFYYNEAYYYHQNGTWFRSPYYRGPWVRTEARGIPPGLYRHRIEELREYKRHAWEDHRERGLRFRERHFHDEDRDERHERENRFE